MNELTPEQMMRFMIRSRREAFYLNVIIWSLSVFLVVAVLLFVNRFLIPEPYRSVVLCVILFSFVTFYISGLIRRRIRYKKGYRNQGPYSGGIYEAYYECPKCQSLYGGIFGKGPTQNIINDSQCIHDWKALYKKDFMNKISIRT